MLVLLRDSEHISRRMVANQPSLLWAAGAVIAGALPLLAADSPNVIVSPEPPKKFQLRIEIGAAYRTFGDVKFNTGSYSRPSDIPQLLPSGSSSELYGATTGFADRTYADGFVFRDINTANPNSFLPGTTAFWSYQQNAQVQGDSLAFHGSGLSSSLSQQTASMANPGWKEGDNGAAAPVLQICLSYPITESLDLGGSLGFMFAAISPHHTSTTFRGLQSYQQQAISVTDTYALNGLIPPLAPYAGLFDPQGPAPLIANVPSQRSQTSTLTDSRSIAFANYVHESLDLSVYTISLGPTLRFHRRRFDAAFSLGLALNIVDWQAKFDESLVATSSTGGQTGIRQWAARSSGVKLLPGFYLQTEIGYRLGRSCSASIFARCDWTKSMHEQVGPSTFNANLDGFTFGGSLNFTF